MDVTTISMSKKEAEKAYKEYLEKTDKNKMKKIIWFLLGRCSKCGGKMVHRWHTTAREVNQCLDCGFETK